MQHSCETVSNLVIQACKAAVNAVELGHYIQITDTLGRLLP